MTSFNVIAEHELIQLRQQVYFEPGLVVFKSFLSEAVVGRLQEFWQASHSFYYEHFIANRDIAPGTPDYVYHRPTPSDFAYCHHLWNQPFDEQLHEIAYSVQSLRNQIEGKPRYHGLHESTGQMLQYRVCKTVSPGVAVGKHADFMEEHRVDPTGDHAFDPVRLQATLFLSDYEKDYKDGGFFLYDSEGVNKRLLGRDVPVSAGDLVLWRYSLSHEVRDVVADSSSQIGFFRIIYPLFDISEGIS